MSKTSNGISRNGVARRSTTSDRQRPVLAASVPAALKQRVEREVHRRNLPTLSAGVEALLSEALAASDEGRRGDVAAAQLQRLNVRLATLEAELRARDALLVELVTTLTRAFLAHTPPPEGAAKEALKQSATERFDRMMSGVRRRLEAGDAALVGLLEVMPTLAEQSHGSEAACRVENDDTGPKM